MSETTKCAVWSDEDGGYHGCGHIPPAEFKTACLALDVMMFGDDMELRAEYGCGQMDLEDVEHLYIYHAPQCEGDDETYEWCEADHPNAEPVTRWTR